MSFFSSVNENADQAGQLLCAALLGAFESLGTHGHQRPRRFLAGIPFLEEAHVWLGHSRCQHGFGFCVCPGIMARGM